MCFAQFKEFITMFANIGTFIAVGFAAKAIFLNTRAVRLQRDSNQVNLFNDISSRIRQLEDQWIACEKKEDRIMWYERLFSAFEYFAFFANKKKISLEMRTYYKSGIETYVNRLTTNEEYSSLFEEYKKRPKEQFSELREYYKNEIGKNLPF